MNKEALVPGHERKKAFLREAIQERVYLKRPKHTSPDQWLKQRRIGFRYAFQDITLEELGRKYGGTRANASELNHNFLDNMNRNSPPRLQAQYPRETIPDGKPRTPLGQISRERLSELNGGRSLRIKKAMEKQGITVLRVEDFDSIANAAGLTRPELLESRPVLENWGFYIDRVRTAYADFAERVRNENDDKKLQELLDTSSAFSLIGFLEKDSKHETLTTLSVIANEQGFHAYTKRIRFVAEKIKKERPKIPIIYIVRKDENGKMLSSRYVVYTKHAERIAEVLRNDPELQRFR